MAVDRTSLGAAVRDAMTPPPAAAPAGQAPAAPPAAAPAPAPAPAPTMAQRAAAHMGGAAAAAAAGQPAAAAAAQPPAKPAAPPSIRERLEAMGRVSPEGLPVTFRGEELNLPLAEAQRLAQIGMLSGDLERQRQELKADQAGYAAFKQFQGWLGQNPDAMRAMQDFYAGRVDPRSLYQQDRTSEDDDNTSADLAARGTTSRADAAAEQRIARLEQTIQMLQAQTTRQSFEQRLEAAVDGHEFLSTTPEIRETALELMQAGLAADKYPSIDAALHSVASKLRKLGSAETDLIRERRQQQESEFRQQPTAGAPPAFPKMPENLPSGPRGLRDPRMRDHLRTIVGGIQRAANAGPIP